MQSISSLALHSPNKPRTKLYTSLLSSESHLSNLSILQTLGPPGSRRYHSGHNVVKTAFGHTGCVNTLHWEEGGEGRLASGGDDTKICIWKAGVEARPISTDSTPLNVTQPALDFGLITSIDTGHRANIFNVKWAPFDSYKLFSAAGDSQVRIFDLNTTASSTQVFSGNRTWNHFDTTSCVRVLKCHTDRVKKIALENSPFQFLTCSEDGTVRQHDLRTSHTCSSSSTTSSSCPTPLLSYSALSLYSLSISKMRPWLFVVAGTSRWTFLHDRRMIRSEMKKDWGIEMNDEEEEGGMTQCVRRFGVPRTEGEVGEHIANHVIATKLSDRNPTELIVSYSDEKIYLFDTDASPTLSHSTYLELNRPPTPPPSESTTMGGKREHLDEEAISNKKKRMDDEVNNEFEALVEEYRIHRESLEDGNSDDEDNGEADEGVDAEDLEATLGGGERGDESEGENDDDFDVAEEEEDDEDDDDDDDEDEDEEDEDDAPFRGRLIPDSLDPFSRLCITDPSLPPIPIIAPRQSYTGHKNVATVKDVNYCFAETFVCSGSDDGNFFIWEKETGKLKGIYKGDSSIVNVLQPHPELPLLAISGIATSFKIFGPTQDLSQRANLIVDMETITKRNQRRRIINLEGEEANERAQALFALISSRIAAARVDEDGNELERVRLEGMEEACLVM